MFTLLLNAMLIGFSIAAPVGPIGVLCIRRTLADGRWYGFVSGLGAATADAFYGSVAAFGLTAVSSLLVDNAIWLRIIGGAFLLYLGIRTLLAKPAEKAAETSSSRSGLIGAYLSIFVLTITNPMTIIAFVGIFAGLGVADVVGNPAAGATMVAGVFLGSAAWWLTLSMGVSLLRSRFTPTWMLWVNRLSGVIILLFAVTILADLLF